MIKFKNQLITILLILLGPYSANSQDILPSVTAEPFISEAGNSKVDLSAGQPSIAYPLHTLSSRDNSISVSMSFNARNVDFETEAGSLGLGWNLHYGGIITRIIRDKADGSINQTPYPDPNRVQWFNNVLNFNDNEEDVFYYSLPTGASGSFKFKDKTLIPDSSFRLEINSDKDWKITDNKGYQYFFTIKEEIRQVPTAVEHTGTSSWFLSSIVSPKGDTISLEYDFEDYRTSYGQVGMSGDVDITEEHINYFHPQNFDSRSGEQINYHTARIKKIITETDGSIDFNYAPRTDIFNINYSGDRKTGFKVGRLNEMVIKNRYNTVVYSYVFDNDDYFSTGPPQPSPYRGGNAVSTRLKLNQVTKKSANNQHSLLAYKFDYDYCFAYGKYGKPDDYLSVGLRNNWTKSVDFFCIFNLDKSVMFQREDYDIDEDGKPWRKVISDVNHITTPSKNGGVSFLLPVFRLKAIEYGTGGKTVFDYESHNGRLPYTDPVDENLRYNHYGFGRLESKTELSRSGEILKKESYYYVLHDDSLKWKSSTSHVGDTICKSSGLFTNYPIYLAIKLVPTYDYGHKSKAHVSTIPLNQKSENNIIYTEVEVVQQDKHGNTIGKDILYYDIGIASYEGNLNYYEVLGRGSGNEQLKEESIDISMEGMYSSPNINNLYPAYYNLPVYDPNKYSSMFMPIPLGLDSSKLKSKLVKKLYLDNANTLLKKEEYEYQELTNHFRGLIVDDRSVSQQDDPRENKQAAYIRDYESIEGKTMMTIKKNTNYTSSGEISSSEENLVDRGFRVYGSKSTTSDNRVLKTVSYFADNLPAGNQNKVVTDMVKRNMISLPLVKITGYEDSLSGFLATQVLIIEYKETDNVIKPYKYYVEKLSIPTNINLANYYQFTIGGDLIIKPNWRLTTKLEYYKNNVIEISEKEALPSIYLWAHNNSRIVAEIKGMSYSALVTAMGQTWLDDLRNNTSTTSIKTKQSDLRIALANSNVFITTYNYHPSFGLESVTDANKQETTSEFDEFGRLIKEKFQGNIIKEYKVKLINEN